MAGSSPAMTVRCLVRSRFCEAALRKGYALHRARDTWLTPPPCAAPVRPCTTRIPRPRPLRCSAARGCARNSLDVGPFCQIDRRRRHGPVDHGDEIGIGDAEMVEQEFAAL